MYASLFHLYSVEQAAVVRCEGEGSLQPRYVLLNEDILQRPVTFEDLDLAPQFSKAAGGVRLVVLAFHPEVPSAAATKCVQIRRRG